MRKPSDWLQPRARGIAPLGRNPRKRSDPYLRVLQTGSGRLDAGRGYPRRGMPVRRTKRGAERTPLSAEADVLICGASFAGLAVARELAGSGARVLVVDRYDIGERQTSACAAPTEWLRRMGAEDSTRQTFSRLVGHTPPGRAR